MSSEWVSYFGFGSLVNRKTRPDQEHAVNATLSGWQRVWGHRVVSGDTRQACTSLSVERAQSSIEGVIVSIRREELPSLDERELGYERIALEQSDFSLTEEVRTSTIHIYRSLEQNRQLADSERPVLQSYIDCVMAGYLERFGESGLQRFMNTTRGWGGPILSDRHRPVYPRSVSLDEDKLRRFDQLLSVHRG